MYLKGTVSVILSDPPGAMQYPIHDNTENAEDIVVFPVDLNYINIYVFSCTIEMRRYFCREDHNWN